MNTGFYTSVSGMSAYQKSMDTVAHNMANVQTFGFKPQQSSFSNALYTEMDTNVEGNNSVGHGVINQGTQLLYGQGAFKSTDRQLDFAIMGNGFFKVERGGAIEYTRDGSFDISVEAEGNFLTTTDGAYVLDNQNNRVSLDDSQVGNVPDFSTLIDKIGVFTFPNPHGLAPSSGNSFLQTPISGNAEVAVVGEYDLKQGGVESSAVDVAKEMTNIITAQKAFSFNAKMVQTADQIAELVNNLR